MRICFDQRSGIGCGASNPDSTQQCQQCGMSLRNALNVHNPGTLIGTYRIVRTIGHGGYGVVYEAEQTHSARQRVALKEAFDPVNVRVFHHEFQILHRLAHDNLPHYYDMFEAHGYGYLVMEYVAGHNVLEVLEAQYGEPLSEAHVMGYAVQLCDVLAYLHSQNPVLIHRDIKPANIRLTPHGLIKLVDFGLFKQGTHATGVSRLGLTPAYAPLEQYGNTGITTPQSDIYSLGASLYHLLTARQPMPVTERIVASTDPFVAPHIYNPRISRHVSDAIVKAMAIQPQHRFATVTAFRQALLVEQTTTSVIAPTPVAFPPISHTIPLVLPHANHANIATTIPLTPATPPTPIATARAATNPTPSYHSPTSPITSTLAHAFVGWRKGLSTLIVVVVLVLGFMVLTTTNVSQLFSTTDSTHQTEKPLYKDDSEPRAPPITVDITNPIMEK